MPPWIAVIGGPVPHFGGLAGADLLMLTNYPQWLIIGIDVLVVGLLSLQIWSVT